MSAPLPPALLIWSGVMKMMRRQGSLFLSCVPDLTPFVPPVRIMEALRSKLDEAGWEDRVRDLARGERDRPVHPLS